jgi:ATP/maltotriose-dependent transcriptional regulator MalT
MQIVEKWTETYEQLLKADQEHELEPEALQTYALAAYLTGRDAECFKMLERAHLSFLDQKKTEQAVRSAFWLGLMLMNAGERARSNGWMARGKRMLNEHPELDCAEKGLFLIPAALGTLSTGDAAIAQGLFEQAIQIGERFGDVDLIALGRLGQGQAQIQLGEVTKGISLLDETMVLVETAEDLFPVVNGIVYCAVIETCRKVWDLERAQEWTSALTRWCDAQPDIVPFRGQCLVRRAEIIQFHGDWDKALDEVSNACKILTRSKGEPAAGEAYYRKAELLRLTGDFNAAEKNYRDAANWGRKPQPGLALLRLAKGENDAAQSLIRNALKEAEDPKKRADLLPAAVLILLAMRQTKEALEATNELRSIAKAFDVPYLNAMSFYCQGALLLSKEDAPLALEHLDKALELWDALRLPYESAHTRELKGRAYRKLNNEDNSEVELAAAKWLFEQLHATPDLERINLLMDEQRVHDSYDLTLRELQVLRIVATGKTNKSVANELFISERTVDRHMSNIFNKLSVSSRVEATTFALRNKLLELPI